MSSPWVRSPALCSPCSWRARGAGSLSPRGSGFRYRASKQAAHVGATGQVLSRTHPAGMNSEPAVCFLTALPQSPWPSATGSCPSLPHCLRQPTGKTHPFSHWKVSWESTWVASEKKTKENCHGLPVFVATWAVESQPDLEKEQGFCQVRTTLYFLYGIFWREANVIYLSEKTA